MNRDEQELVNVFNSVNNLAGTFARTRAQGLQTDEYLNELEAKKRRERIDNRMTTGLSRGETPEQLSRTTEIRGPGWKDDYNSLNVGLKPGNRDYVPAEGFTRSSDVVGSAEVQKSLNDAMAARVDSFKQKEEMGVQEFRNKLASMPVDQVLNSEEVKTGSFAKYGDKAGAASRAYSLWLADYSKLNENSASVVENRRKVVAQKWEEHAAKVNIAESLYSSGRVDEADKHVESLINDSILAHKTERQQSGKYKLKITTEGEDAYSKEEYTGRELLEKIKKIGREEYTLNTSAAIEHRRQENIKYAKDPVYMIDNKGNIVQAVARGDLFSNDFRYYATINGKEYGVTSIEDFKKQGFKRVEVKKEEDANTARSLAITGNKIQISNSVKEGRIKDAQLNALNRKNTEEKNIQLIRDKRKEATKAFAQDLWSKGIEVNFDPDTGEINIDKNTMLTQAQKDMVDKVASRYGFNASLRPVEDGIDNGWFRDDTVGYRFGGVSGFEAPGDKGLSRSGTNQGKSGPVMSRGEFDATITGQENKQPPVKTGKGLIERAYNSVVPADGFADTVVKKGFGPIPGQAKELAGVVYEKGLKPIPGQVKVVAKAVAKPFAAPYSAAAKLTKLKVLKNKLSHAESDKEKKEIKAEIEALSKSK